MSQNHISPTKKIEYPQLKKIGGFRNFALKISIKVIIIVLISSLVGGLSGYAVQKRFRDITGFNKNVPATTEVQAVEGIKADAVKDTSILGRIADATSALSESLKNSEIIQKANEASLNIILATFKPFIDMFNGLMGYLDKAAFWITFILTFAITAWLTDKIFYTKKYLLTNGVDPQVIRNMEVLETKVKELTDHANKSIIN